MQIHELENVGKKKRKRVGRGGKRGTTAGRGTKGQKSRSGGNVNPLFEGGRSSLVQRMKKNRGFNSPHAGQKAISLSTLAKNYADGEIVTLESLRTKKLIRNREVKGGVRLVAGEISAKLTISGMIALSQSAREAVIKAGGTIEESVVVEQKKKSDKS